MDQACTLNIEVRSLLSAGQVIAAIDRVEAYIADQALDSTAVIAAMDILLHRKDAINLISLTEMMPCRNLGDAHLCESIAKALFSLGMHDALRSQMYRWMHKCNQRTEILQVALGTFQAIKDRQGATIAKTLLIDSGLCHAGVYDAYLEFLSSNGLATDSGKYLCETPTHHHRPRLLYPVGGSKRLAIEGVMIDINLNFSNFLIQLANAICFASRTGLGKVHIGYSGAAKNIFPSSTSFVCSLTGIHVCFDPHPGESIALAGCFFFFRESFPTFFSGLPSIRQHLQGIQHATRFCEARPLKQTDGRRLTIHIRSGDIFKKMIHPLYGQPPLSYYQLAIRHYGPDSVVLVFEDESNPVVAALQEWIDLALIDMTIASSSDACYDAMHLATAEALVISAGTFAAGPLCFNNAIRILYTFNHRNCCPYLPPNSDAHAPVHFNISDTPGEYIDQVMNGNWANTAAQRELMLSYPEEQLQIEILEAAPSAVPLRSISDH